MRTDSKVTALANRGHISHFLTSCKIRGGMGEKSQSISPVQPRTKPLMYFQRGAALPSKDYSLGVENNSRKIEGLQRTSGSLINVSRSVRNPYSVHDVLERLVGSHLMREVVAHITDHLELCPLLAVHHVPDGVQVVGEVHVVDESGSLGVAVLLDEQSDVLLVDAQRFRHGAVELRLVDHADVVEVELVTELTHVNAAPRVEALKSTQQRLHVHLILYVKRSQRPPGAQKLLCFDLQQTS